MKKSVITLILILTLTTMTFVHAGTSQISDIEGHWAKGYIGKLMELGTINGYPNGTFKPNNSVKVGEFTKILVTSLGYTDIENSANEHWSLNYIKKAEEIGLIDDSDFSLSDLDRDINRGEMASMIIKAIPDERIEDLRPCRNQIKDLYKASIPMNDYIATAYGLGIITGYPDGEFKQEKTATRGESSTMIVRMLNKEERVVPKIDEHEKEEDYDKDSQKKISEDIKNTKFWNEGIKAANEYIKEEQEKEPDNVYYGEEMYELYNFQQKDIDNAYNMAYDFAMDMHNYNYKKDTEELRSKLAKKYLTFVDGSVNPEFLNVWWDFAKAEKVIKKAIFVADKNCLYKDKYTILRGRLYFKYDSLERLKKPSEMPYGIWYEHYLGREIMVKNFELYEVKEDRWYYKDMDVYLTPKTYAAYFNDNADQSYYHNAKNWDKNISDFKEVSKDIDEELEKYIENK